MAPKLSILVSKFTIKIIYESFLNHTLEIEQLKNKSFVFNLKTIKISNIKPIIQYLTI